jgi:hypothetical protein
VPEPKGEGEPWFAGYNPADSPAVAQPKRPAAAATLAILDEAVTDSRTRVARAQAKALGHTWPQPVTLEEVRLLGPYLRDRLTPEQCGLRSRAGEVTAPASPRSSTLPLGFSSLR